MAIIAQASALVRWPAQQQVPLGGYYHAFRNDGAGGEIDYDNRINPRPVLAWEGGGGKMGFGLGPFGQDAWGFGDGGVGWGEGCFGLGMFGFDAAMHNLVTPLLDDATWDLAVIAYDDAGNADAAGRIEKTIALAGVPGPPGTPVADSWNGGTDTLTLSFARSKHDTT